MKLKQGPDPIHNYASLWRYVDLPTLLMYLNGEWSLRSVYSLSQMDPNEGKAICDDVTQAVEFDEAEMYELWDYFSQTKLNRAERDDFNINWNHPTYRQTTLFRHWREEISRRRFAMCFFEKLTESTAMWNLYARSGALIRTDLRSIKKALSKSNCEWIVGKIVYRGRVSADDALQPIDQQLLRRPFFFKRIEYCHESEVRLVTTGERVTDSLTFKVKPAAWIREIRFSPYLWRGGVKFLTEMLQKRHPFLRSRIQSSTLMPECDIGIDPFLEPELPSVLSKL